MLIELDNYVQDDQGAQWHVIQEVRHFKTPTIKMLILKEHCLESRDPRAAIVRTDGEGFVSTGSIAKRIVSIVRRPIGVDSVGDTSSPGETNS